MSVEAFVDRERNAFLRTGVIASTIANMAQGNKRHYKPSDFMPKAAEKPQTSDDHLRILQQYVAVNG